MKWEKEDRLKLLSITLLPYARSGSKKTMGSASLAWGGKSILSGRTLEGRIRNKITYTYNSFL